MASPMDALLTRRKKQLDEDKKQLEEGCARFETTFGLINGNQHSMNKKSGKAGRTSLRHEKKAQATDAVGDVQGRATGEQVRGGSEELAIEAPADEGENEEEMLMGAEEEEEEEEETLVEMLQRLEDDEMLMGMRAPVDENEDDEMLMGMPEPVDEDDDDEMLDGMPAPVDDEDDEMLDGLAYE